MTVLSILKEKFIGTTMMLYRSKGEWYTNEQNQKGLGWFKCTVIDVELVVEYAGRTYYNFVCESIMFDDVIKIELPLS